MKKESDAALEDALKGEVGEVLANDHSLRAAATRLVNHSSPFIEEACSGVSFTEGLNVDMACRSIIRRAHDALSAVAVTATSEAKVSARVHLRTLAEDLIFVRWIRNLGDETACEFLTRSTRVEILKAIEAQLHFLPIAYERLGAPIPDLVFSDPTSTLDQAKTEFKDFCQAQGWGKKPPTIFSMAENLGLLDEYRFFYFLSSKAVHSNLHEIGRMAWGDGKVGSISSTPFAGVHADLAVIYGTWLFSEVLHSIAADFHPIGKLVDTQAYCVWLAMILVGPARTGRLPLLIHPEELKWQHPPA